MSYNKETAFIVYVHQINLLLRQIRLVKVRSIEEVYFVGRELLREKYGKGRFYILIVRNAIDMKWLK